MINKSKKIWIIGASTGIGRALAKKFSREGWLVAASARSVALLENLAKDNNIISYPLDITDSNRTIEIFDKIKKNFKDLDLCIYCAGTYLNNFDNKFDIKQSRNVMEVNFFGAINCVNAIEKFFKQKKNGHVAFISSIFSYRGLPYLNDYCASKAALSTFVESLYFEFKRYNLKVSLINPAFVKSDMTLNSKFKIPFIKYVSTQYAADKIYLGLIKKKSFEIHFPKIWSIMMKLLKFMPNWLFLLIGSLAKKMV